MMTRAPWCSSGTNGIGGADVRDRRQRLRCGIGLGEEGVDRLSRCRQQQHPAHDPFHVVEAQPEPRRHAEVAAAAADRPEQVGVRLGVDTQELALRRDDVGGEQVVDRETVGPDEVADTAAEGDPADPHRSRVAEPDREAVLGGRVRELGGGEAGLGPGRSGLGVDLDRLPPREVEDDPAVGHAVTGDAVAAAADRERQAALAGGGDDAGDVVVVRDANDDRRPTVEAAVEQSARPLVLGIARRDDLAGHDRSKHVGGGRGHVGPPRCRHGRAALPRRSRQYGRRLGAELIGSR
jgi:hypothetical protein